MSSENIALLANGCLCCVVRTDLQETLRDAVRAAPRRRGGRLRPRDHRDHRPRRPGAGGPDARQRHDARRALPARRRGDAGRRGERRRRSSTSDAEAVKQVALADRVLHHQDRPRADAASSAARRGCASINPARRASPTSAGRDRPARPDRPRPGQRARRRRDAALPGEALARRRVGGDGAYLGAGRAARTTRRSRTLTLRFDRPFTWTSVHRGDGAAGHAARAGPAAREGHRQRRRRTAGGRAGRAARLPPAGDAGPLAQRRPALAARLHHPPHRGAGRVGAVRERSGCCSAGRRALRRRDSSRAGKCRRRGCSARWRGSSRRHCTARFTAGAYQTVASVKAGSIRGCNVPPGVREIS